MYEDLVKALRKTSCFDYSPCDHRNTCEAEGCFIQKAADAIEALSNAGSAYGRGWTLGYDAGREESKPRWIPVTERLPKDNEAVNVTWINRDPASYYQHIKDKPFVATGVYYRGQWYWWSSVVEDYLAEYGKCDFEKIDEAIDITHWMLLPTPPTAEEGEK